MLRRMTVLAVDVGSSSVKAARLKGTEVLGRVRRVPFATVCDGSSVEVRPGDLQAAIHHAIDGLTRGVDAIVLGCMSPAMTLLDRRGKPLTNFITHQDRRSTAEAQQLAETIGEQRYRDLAGLAPTPGGVAATSFAWLKKHQPQTVKSAAGLAQLPTWIHASVTGRFALDPGNAGFTGLWSVQSQDWHDDLLAAAGVPRSILPEVHDGATTFAAKANALGVPTGMPVTVGVIDGSGVPLLGEARPGTLTNTVGSTDVLALVSDRPITGEGLMCRHLGTGDRWMIVATEAAAGSAIEWTRQTLFAGMSWPRFKQQMAAAMASPDTGGVVFNPSLAGSRLSVVQPTGAFTGLTLGTTRLRLLTAVLAAMSQSSQRRLDRLTALGVPLRPGVLTSGGESDLGRLLRRHWPKTLRMLELDQASLRGLGRLRG